MNGKMRGETDSFGTLLVPKDMLYGAQTARSLMNFNIGTERMPSALIISLAIIKKCAATVNKNNLQLDERVADAIIKSCDEILDGTIDLDHFPLSVWQTGSGTQTNMNLNEVISNRATELLGGDISQSKLVHPNDHCNLGQSSNDTFPTAMHIAAVLDIKAKLIPAISALTYSFAKKEAAWSNLIKIGRTHMQDATPLSLGQEIGAFKEQLKNALARIQDSLTGLHYLAQGGTAVGTGINTFCGFDVAFAEQVSAETSIKFKTAPNKFEALASNDAYLHTHSAITTLATALFKIANDIRMLGSGPRAGLGELSLPENEPGSSIMPGKVNPTQCEAMTMVCARVHGNQSTIAFAATQGHFQLNVFKPVMANSMHQSIDLLSDAIVSFKNKCIDGIEPNPENIKKLVERSLMLVTALTPVIGYDLAADIAKSAHKKQISLKEEVLQRGTLNSEQFDRLMNVETMIYPSSLK